MTIVAQQAQSDPAQAAALLDRIRDDELRSMATATIVGSWHQYSPEAATDWVRSLPASAARDAAVVTLARRWIEPTDAQLALVNEIGNVEHRVEAKINLIYAMAVRNPDRAERMLDDVSLSPYQRKQIEQRLARFRRRW
jgi:hypothetical protein